MSHPLHMNGLPPDDISTPQNDIEAIMSASSSSASTTASSSSASASSSSSSGLPSAKTDTTADATADVSVRLTPVALAHPMQSSTSSSIISGGRGVGEEEGEESLDRRSFPTLDAAATEFFVDAFKRLADFRVPIYKLAFSLSAAAAASSMSASTTSSMSSSSEGSGVSGGAISNVTTNNDAAAATIEEIKTYIRLHDHGLKVIFKEMVAALKFKGALNFVDWYNQSTTKAQLKWEERRFVHLAVEILRKVVSRHGLDKRAAGILIYRVEWTEVMP